MSIANPITNPTASPPSDGSRPVRPRRLVLAIGAVALGLVLAVVVTLLVWPTDGPHDPVVTFVQPVPADVEAEARTAVAAFVDRFASRRDCVGGAEVVLVDDVPDGDARYLGADATIEVEIPTSPRRFRDSLVHELAHHVERRCADSGTLRAAVLAVTGDEAWSGQPRWADRPAELWAEAVVEIVLGERVRFGRTVPLDPALVDAVRAWIVAEPAVSRGG
jgi:hypothetical protein